MDIPFQQLNSLIINSYKPIYTSMFSKGTFSISLEEYIKSQLHFNIVGGLWKRDLKIYAGALKYIQGNDEYFSDFCKVLRYFYLDMSNVILKVLPLNEDIDIQIDTHLDRDVLLERKQINLQDFVGDMELLLSGKYDEVQSEELVQILDKLQFKYISSMKSNTVTILALMLLHYSSSSSLVLLEAR